MFMGSRLLLGSLAGGAIGVGLVQSSRLSTLLADRKGDKKPYLAEQVPSRSAQLTRIRDCSREKPFDLLIIGGGATGAGCAVDAATR